MGKQPTNLIEVVTTVAQLLHGHDYAIRGTTSLVLQGIDMNVDDIDIVCTRETALQCNQLFAEYLDVPVQWQESENFKSYFGKFKIDGIQVEIMGNWQIMDTRGKWSEIFTGMNYITKTYRGVPVRLTTIESEIRMFTAMGRWTALRKIKLQLPQSASTEQTSLQL